MWMEYNPNPAQKATGDCAVRALTKVLDVDWERAFAILAKNGFIMGDMPSSNVVISATLRQNGYYRNTIPNECPDCYTIGDFAREHNSGTYVVGTGNHVVAVKDGNIYDSWDSSKEVPVYYWYKKDDG